MEPVPVSRGRRQRDEGATADTILIILLAFNFRLNWEVGTKMQNGKYTSKSQHEHFGPAEMYTHAESCQLMGANLL